MKNFFRAVLLLLICASRSFTQNNQPLMEYIPELDKIYYYTNGYYSKWEAEDRPGTNTLGLLSHFGSNPDGSWATSINDTSHTGDFLYGPFYRQDKRYRMTYLHDTINYTTHFSIKLGSVIDTSQSNPVVCRLKVRYTYILNTDTITTLLGQNDVYKNDLSTASFSGNLSTTTIVYDYSSIMMGDEPTDIYLDPQKAAVPINDEEPGLGIEFVVEWTKKYNIIVDNITVYDEAIWSRYLLNPPAIENEIHNYASSSPFSGMTNLLYWGGIDEPFTLDSYEPIRIVDSILVSNGHKSIVTKPLQHPEIQPQSR